MSYFFYRYTVRAEEVGHHLAFWLVAVAVLLCLGWRYLLLYRQRDPESRKAFTLAALLIGGWMFWLAWAVFPSRWLHGEYRGSYDASDILASLMQQMEIVQGLLGIGSAFLLLDFPARIVELIRGRRNRSGWHPYVAFLSYLLLWSGIELLRYDIRLHSEVLPHLLDSHTRP